MNWQEKVMALQALGRVDLKMRAPGDWYVHQHGVGIQVIGEQTTTSAYGKGATPELAVEDHWRQYVDDLHGRTIRIEMDGTTRNVRWNGFMWRDAT